MRHLLLILSLFCNTLNVQAQHNAKSTATESRLIASSSAKFDGNAMIPDDSTALSYASNLGWDPLLKLWKYDHADSYENTNNDYFHFYKIDRIFNTQQQIISSVGEVWDDNSWDWLVESKDRFSYITSGQIDTSISGHYNGSFWDSIKTVNTYDVNGYLTNSLIQKWDYLSSTWEDMARETYTYSGNDLAQVLTEKLIGINWVNDNRVSYQYDTGGEISIAETQQWNSGAWINAYRLNHSYNSDNERIQTIRQVYSGGNYVNQFEIIRTFNSFHQVETETGKSWSVMNNQFEYAAGDYSEHFYYEIYSTVIDGKERHTPAISIFPIPSSEVINIVCGNERAVELTASIRDITGKKVRELRNCKNSCSINVSGLNTGRYVLHLEINGQALSQIVAIQ